MLFHQHATELNSFVIVFATHVFVKSYSIVFRSSILTDWC